MKLSITLTIIVLVCASTFVYGDTLQNCLSVKQCSANNGSSACNINFKWNQCDGSEGSSTPTCPIYLSCEDLCVCSCTGNGWTIDYYDNCQGTFRQISKECRGSCTGP